MAQLRPSNLGHRFPSNSSVITPPATVRHHYIKRSSVMSSAQFTNFQPPPPLRSSSYGSCASSSGTSDFMNSQAPPVSFSQFSSVRHATSLASSASSAEAPVTDPSCVCIKHPQPIVNVQSQYSQSAVQRSGSPANALPLSPLALKLPITETMDDRVLPSYPINLPTPQIDLQQAMKTEVVDGFGKAVKFEELIDREFRTLVIFIRHFRCGYSQRYIKRLSMIANSGMLANNSTSDSSRLRRKTSVTSAAPSHERGENPAENWISANGVKIIVIGNGKYQLIESYRSILNCPFPIYTDLSKDQEVYKLLGMKKVRDSKPINSSGYPIERPISVSVNIQSESNVHYLHDKKMSKFDNNHLEPLVGREETRLAFFSKVFLNALRMPWKWSGDPDQLGGEIVFEPIIEARKIKRKPLKYTFANDQLVKSNSIRSTSSLATSATLTDDSPSNQPCTLIKRPSCSIKNNPQCRPNLSLRRNLNSVHESAKDIQIQCKFIHQMTNFQDHFSINELMMLAGIRLTAFIQKC